MYGHLSAGGADARRAEAADAPGGVEHAAADRRYRAAQWTDREQRPAVDLRDVPHADRRRHQSRPAPRSGERARRDSVGDSHRSVHHVQSLGPLGRRRPSPCWCASPISPATCRRARGRSRSGRIEASRPRAVLDFALAACGNLDDPGSQTLVMARVKDAIDLDPSHATDGLSRSTSPPRSWKVSCVSGPARSR